MSVFGSCSVVGGLGFEPKWLLALSISKVGRTQAVLKKHRPGAHSMKTEIIVSVSAQLMASGAQRSIIRNSWLYSDNAPCDCPSNSPAILLSRGSESTILPMCFLPTASLIFLVRP